MSRHLADGLILRTAGPADLDRIADLLTRRGEAADAVDHRLVVTDPEAGWESCAVVVDGERVVSTVTLLDETVTLSGVPIPVGQVELVATDPEYEGRGLIRALMGWAHERSAARGHLLQVMVGIPYFYRQFGYEYSIVLPQSRAVRGAPPAPDGCVVRTAGVGDIPAMSALQDATQSGYDLVMPHSAACWRWLAARDGSAELIVERAGRPVATGRITPPEEGVVLGEIAATDAEAAHALLAHAVRVAGTGDVEVKERPGSIGGEAIEPFLASRPPGAARYYTRVPDVAALLGHLRPVLAARLATSGRGEAVVSFYRHHVTIPYADGAVGEIRRGGTMQAPGAVGGAGVAPDLAGSLLLGPYGIAGLAERHADVYPGPNADLMRTLFPPVTADLMTFYLP